MNGPIRTLAIKTAAAVGVAGGILLGAWVVWQLMDAILVVFTGVLIAIFLSAVSGAVGSRVHVSYPVSVGLVITAILALLVGLSFAYGPDLVRQTEQFATEVPRLARELGGRLSQETWGHWLVSGSQSGGNLMTGFTSRFSAVSLFSSVSGALAAALIAVAIGCYLAFDFRLYRRTLLRLAPLRAGDSTRTLIEMLSHDLRSWLVGRAVSMGIVAVMTVAGLLVLGVPMAVLLGLIAGLLAFVPYIGPIVSVIPAAILAFQQGGRMVLYVFALYLAIQLVESNLITPLVQKRAVRLPPALVLGWQFFAGILGGVPALIVATPLLVTVVASVRVLYLGESDGAGRDDSAEAA